MKAKRLVVDTAAFVKNLPLWEYGEEFYSVTEVIAEIRDKIARQRYEALPVSVTMREPQPWAIRFINQFSKKTGDYASLSLADVKIVALAYELEIEARGSSDHLRLEPQKPIVEGYASKPNLDDQANVAGFHVPTEECDGLLTNSSDNVLSESCTRDVQTNSSNSSCGDLYNDEDPNVNQHQDQTFISLSSLSLRNSPSDSNQTANIYWRHMLGLEEFLLGHSYIGGYSPTSDDSDIYKALIKEYPQFSPLPKDKYAALFSTHNLPPPTTIRPLHSTFPCIRRWSYHIASFSKEERSQFPSSSRDIKEVLHEFGENVQNTEVPVTSAVPSLIVKNTALLDPALQVDMNALSITEKCNGVDEVEDANKKERTVSQSSIDNDVASEGDSSHTKESHEDSEISSSCEEADLQNEDDFEGVEDNSEDLEYFGENEEEEEDDDEEGWITPSNIKRHKLKSNNKPVAEEEKEKDVLVACITSDFAVQNLLKHIGLTVMGVDGKLIWQIRTYILRCYACFKTTSDMTKIFCPKCGNKTLKRVSVTVNPDGTQKIFINFKKPINTKGMRFTLPRPRGGQHARNPILVADQREVKQFSSKKSKKKINPLHEDFDPNQAPFAVRDVYSRAAQLGYMGGKCHNHYYWESKNPNAPMKKFTKKKK